MAPLSRIEFASSDPLEIRDFLHRVRGVMRLPADITFRMSGRDEVVIHTILGGRAEVHHGQDSHRDQHGDMYVASCPRVDFTCQTLRS